MADIYFISGAWMDDKGNPSHYCVHQLLEAGITKGKKLSREQVIGILTRYGKTVYLLQWDYEKGKFAQGLQVQLVQGVSINTVPISDDHLELKHIINYDWLPKEI